MASPKPAANPDRRAGIIMSVIATIGFAIGGINALWSGTVTLPGRAGPVHNTGASADLMGWLLLAASAGFLCNLAMLIQPGRRGVPWVIGVILLWAAALAVFYLLRYAGT